MVGAETLALQGLPREKLNLNRESSKQLVDLTGNAMSTPAVGSAILAGFIAASEWFQASTAVQEEPENLPELSPELTSPMEYDSSWRLVEEDLTAHRRVPMTVAQLQALASTSLRLCACESLILSTRKTFKRCSRCGHSSCMDCGKKPPHHYVKIGSIPSRAWGSALNFEEHVRKALPPRLVALGLLAAYQAATTMRETRFGEDYAEAVEAAASEGCQLVSVKRDRVWRITYESRRARIVLVCERKWDGKVPDSENTADLPSAITAQWNFYAKPKAELPANSQIRKDLMFPIARLKCCQSVFTGQWEVRSPESQVFTLEVLGAGDKVPSWEMRQGIQHPLFKNRHVWSALEFRLPADSTTSADIVPDNILGRYELLPDCGTASGSLHVKQNSSLTTSDDPVFLLLESNPLENASHDYFVFADQHHKLGMYEVREPIATIDSTWRPTDTEKVLQLVCEVPHRWIPVDDVDLQEYSPRDLQTVYLASEDVSLRVDNSLCNSTGLPMVWCEFPTTQEISEELGRKARKSIELVNDRFSLAHLSWLMKSIGQALESTDWQDLPSTDRVVGRCTICSPVPPSVAWKLLQRKKTEQIRPFEDVAEACDYERAVRAAPEAATAELSYNQHLRLASLRIDFNILTLVHKAVAALSDARGWYVVPSKVHWRAVVDHEHDYPVNFPILDLKNCLNETEAAHPPSFNHETPLNSKQLKSLAWMIDREKDQDDSWIEQEIVEAQVAPMNLRLEARVTAPRKVMGGVLADDVGYGKTALVLAIIDHHFKKTNLVSSPPFKVGVDDRIALKATLILVPGNLLSQWETEFNKFIKPDTYELLVLTHSNFVELSTVSNFQKADIILAPWDLFKDGYFKQMARMSRAYHTPISAGRGFEEWFQMAQKDLKTMVKNSNGLDSSLLSTAWNTLADEKHKYKRFEELSKRKAQKAARTKKGAGGRPRAEEPDLEDAEEADLEDAGQEESLPDQSDIQDNEQLPVPEQADVENNEQQPNAEEANPEVPIANTEIEAPRNPFLPLHACSFQRLVVDEFTYVQPIQLPAILGLQADRRWILSGTPPDNTLNGVRSMAILIGTTVGRADDAEVRYQKIRGTTVEFTGGEALRSYATIRSPSWHKARNQKAAEFIDRFVRKNTSLVDVQQQRYYTKVKLPAPQRALYHESYLKLINHGVKMGCRLSKIPPSTRSDQLDEQIGISQSPEDALITFASTMPEFAIEKPNSKPCESTIAEKQSLIVNLVEQIAEEIRGAFWLMAHYKDKVQNIPFIYHYLRSVQENRFGDATVRHLLDLVFAHASNTRKWTLASGMEDKNKNSKAASTDEGKFQYASRGDAANAPLSLSQAARADDLRMRADTLTSWTIKLTDLIREMRYFVGTKRCMSSERIKCASCKIRTNDYGRMLFMGRCGHVACNQCCFTQSGEPTQLSHCLNLDCGSKTSQSTAILAAELISPINSPRVRKHGSKLVAITDLLAQIPSGEKILVFVQFPRILAALKSILLEMKIGFADTDLKGASAEVQRFKETQECRVCLLQIDNVNAAGWNLQAANHIIFVSSLVAKTQHEYNSSLTQAIGRAFRLGQAQDVHIYQFLAEGTIDVNVLEGRTGMVLVERGSECLLVPEPLVGDRAGFRGLPFVGGAFVEEVEGGA
jgi:SNF2-related domain